MLKDNTDKGQTSSRQKVSMGRDGHHFCERTHFFVNDGSFRKNEKLNEKNRQILIVERF